MFSFVFQNKKQFSKIVIKLTQIDSLSLSLLDLTKYIRVDNKKNGIIICAYLVQLVVCIAGSL